MTKAKEMRELTSGIDVDANGNVGIGTDSPNSRLEVNETITFNNADTFAQLNVKTTSGNLGNMLNIGVDETNELSFLQSMKRGTGYKPLILQRYGGNVGIGTDNPSELLHANGSIRLTTDVSTTRRLYALSGTGPYALNSSGGAAIAFHRDATNNDEIAFETHWQGNQHAERMRIDNQGNVGIGTSTPDTILEIVSSNPILTLRDTGSGFNNGDATLRLAESGPGDTLGGYFDVRLDASMLKFDFTPEGGSVSTYMAINSSDGNVGIGETSPAGKLEVQNTSVNYAILGTSNNGHYFESQSDDNTDGFEIYQQHGSTTTRNSFIVNDNRTGSKSAALVVRGDGNVGIGTTNPAKLLSLETSGDCGFSLRTTAANTNAEMWEITAGANASSNADLTFRSRNDDGTGGQEVLRLQYGGNVGIGTSSPQRKIHSVDSNGQVLRLQRDGAFTGSWDLSIGTQTTGDFTVYDNENSQRAITVEKLTGFSGTSAMYIDSNGRVGIGTASPSATLDVSDSTLSTTRTTSGSYHLTGYQYATGFAYLLTNGQFEIGTSGPHVNILKTNNTERLRITTAGDLLVGTTSTGGGRCVIETTSTNQLVLSNKDTGADAQYAAYFLRNNSIVGSIQTSNTSSSFVTSSDYRLKENVTDVTNGITRVKQLEPKRFNFIADPDKTVDGFLAHEAQAVVPEAVTGTQDAMRDEEYEVTPAVLDENGNEVTPAVMGTRSVPDYQGIDQSKLVPLLTAALKESIAKIEALEARVTALES